MPPGLGSPPGSPCRESGADDGRPFSRETYARDASISKRADQFTAGLAELEARLTWRFAGAMLAQTGVILAAVIGAAIAILRMPG